MTDRTRVRVTPDTCAGTGVCTFYASNTFGLDDAGRVTVVAEYGDPDSDVRNAAEACPTRSIHVES